MVFSRTTGDSGPQEWRRTCQQTSCLLLLVEVATRNSTHPAHAWVLKLPFQTPSSPHPQAALCWFSPDAAQGPPKTGSGLGVRVFGVKWDEEKKKRPPRRLFWCKLSQLLPISRIAASPFSSASPCSGFPQPGCEGGQSPLLRLYHRTHGTPSLPFFFFLLLVLTHFSVDLWGVRRGKGDKILRNQRFNISAL